MTFPKARPKMRGKVGDELWSAGSYETDPDRTGIRYYGGILRCQGSPRWFCPHVRHKSSAEARTCAAEELKLRLEEQAE